MREIKFRAWDKKANVMREVIELNWTIGLVTRLCNGAVYDLPDIILMQYTGLHDKNGQEIYEGDIVRFFSRDESPEVMTLIWSQDNVRFMVLDNQNHDWSFDDSNVLEVIGNIYENPELLEAT